MLDCPEAILSMGYRIWRGQGMVDSKRVNMLIATGRFIRFGIADRVHRFIHKAERACCAICSTARNSGRRRTGKLVWLRSRIAMKDIREESLAASGACSAPYRDYTLLALYEDLAQLISGDAKSKGAAAVRDYG